MKIQKNMNSTIDFSLTLREMLTIVSILESQANHMFGQQKVTQTCQKSGVLCPFSRYVVIVYYNCTAL